MLPFRQKLMNFFTLKKKRNHLPGHGLLLDTRTVNSQTTVKNVKIDAPISSKIDEIVYFFFEREMWLLTIDIELFENLNLTYRARNRARLDLGRKFVNTN